MLASGQNKNRGQARRQPPSTAAGGGTERSSISEISAKMSSSLVV